MDPENTALPRRFRTFSQMVQASTKDCKSNFSFSQLVVRFPMRGLLNRRGLTGPTHASTQNIDTHLPLLFPIVSQRCHCIDSCQSSCCLRVSQLLGGSGKTLIKCMQSLPSKRVPRTRESNGTCDTCPKDCPYSACQREPRTRCRRWADRR